MSKCMHVTRKGKSQKHYLNRKENTCLQSLDQRCEASHSRCVVANAINAPLSKDQGPAKQQRISCSHGHCKHWAGHGKWQKVFLFVFDCLVSFVENILPNWPICFNLQRQICCPWLLSPCPASFDCTIDTVLANILIVHLVLKHRSLLLDLLLDLPSCTSTQSCGLSCWAKDRKYIPHILSSLESSLCVIQRVPVETTYIFPNFK